MLLLALFVFLFSLKSPDSVPVSSLTAPKEFPKGQELRAELQSTGQGLARRKHNSLSSASLDSSGGGKERAMVSFPRKTRGFHVSTNLSSLIVALSGFWGKRNLETMLLQAPGAHQLRRAAAPVSFIPYSAGGLA